MTEFAIWLSSKEDAVLVVFGAVTVLLGVTFIISWRRSRYVERENHYLEIQRFLLQQYYEMQQEQILQTRKLRHDIANHLHTVETLQEDGKIKDAEKYRQYLAERYQELKQAGYVSDPMVDAVLFQKAEYCRENGIKMDVELMGLQMEWMEDFERMQFFFELTEYAIWKVMDSRKGRAGGSIHLYTKSDKGYVFIGCEMIPAEKRLGDRKTALSAVCQIVEGKEGFVKLEKIDNGQRILAAFRKSGNKASKKRL